MAPLTPPDCDLTDFAYMPLDVARLRNSEMVTDESPEACWASVLLWCASWHQVPAGSIPDNDKWIASQCGYLARGKIDEAWENVREGALRGFIKCSDGRLYHPVVCEKANESWESKLRHAYGKMAERARKTNKQRAEKGLNSVDIPAYPQWISSGRVDPVPPEDTASSAGIPPESTTSSAGSKAETSEPSAGTPPENALKGKGEGDIRDIPSSLRSEGGPASAAQTPPPKPEKPKREQVTLTAYLAVCKAAGAKPVPDDHHSRQWANDAGLSAEMQQIAWLLFRERYTLDEKGKGKRYKDWPGHFANAIKGNWFKLWFMGDDGRPAWTSVGLTHKAALDAKAAKSRRVADHA